MTEVDDAATRSLAGQLVAAMARRGERIAVAESLTGGLLADAFVSIPGASKVFLGGAVTYATQSKNRVLGVSAELLEAKGAPDAEVARAMAWGVRELFGASLALATTGVAGPEPQDGREPGTVFVALATESGTRATELFCPGSRDGIRRRTVQAALALLEEYLERA